MQESWFTTWDSDANSDDRTLMVSQGTPEVFRTDVSRYGS